MFLPRRRSAGALSDRNKRRTLASQVENGTRGEIVIQHDIGGAKAARRLQRQEFGITWTPRDKGDETAHPPSAIK